MARKPYERHARGPRIKCCVFGATKRYKNKARDLNERAIHSIIIRLYEKFGIIYA